jgi:hypothetical protein
MPRKKRVYAAFVNRSLFENSDSNRASNLGSNFLVLAEGVSGIYVLVSVWVCVCYVFASLDNVPSACVMNAHTHT